MNYEEKRKWRNWMNPDFEKQRQRGRVWGGLILVGVGSALMAHKLGVIMPAWLFTWPIILILAGIYTLGKNGFKRPGGLIPIAIGGVFLAEHLLPGMQISQIAWPALAILVGLFLIFSPKRNCGPRGRRHWEKTDFVNATETGSSEDFINIDSVFGGVNKTVITKNLKGGTINCVFGGAEINLLQADIQGQVTMDINTVFGGVEMIVPSSWKVQSEVSAVLGGVEDKRAMSESTFETDKILVLKGSVIFGGLSIKGY